MERWFTADFGGWVHWRDALAATPPEGYASCCEALSHWDFRSELIGVSVPTLVIVGAQDPATTPADAELIADAIPGAKLVVIPHAAHLLNVEQPEAFMAAVLDHLVA